MQQHEQLAEQLLLEWKRVIFLDKEGIGEARQSWSLEAEECCISFLRAAVITYHKLDDLKQHKCISYN